MCALRKHTRNIHSMATGPETWQNSAPEAGGYLGLERGLWVTWRGSLVIAGEESGAALVPRLKRVSPGCCGDVGPRGLGGTAAS